MNNIDKQFNELGLKGALMVDKMADKFNRDYNFQQASDIVRGHGGEDLLLGMEKIKAIRIDELYDIEDANHKEHLVSAYRVVYKNMAKLFN